VWDPYAEFEKAVLPNGLTIYAAYWPERSWEAVNFLVHSGARLDHVGLEGTAHFVEHLVSRNANIPYSEIKKFFDETGGWVELGVTSFHSTWYKFFTSITESHNFEKALSIFGSMLITANLKNFVEAQRQVILAEFQRKYPAQFRIDLAWKNKKILHRDDWPSRSITPMGYPDSINRIFEKDIQDYYDQHYTPSNISVVCVGGLRIEEIVKLFSDSPFGIKKEGIRSTPLVPSESVLPPTENRYVLELSKHIKMDKPLESVGYSSTVVIPGKVNVRALGIAQRMLNEILFNEVRETRGWTYSINASSYNDRSFREVLIESSSLALGSLDYIEDVIEECLTAVSCREDLFKQIVKKMIVRHSMIDTTAKSICDTSMDDVSKLDRIETLVEDNDLLFSPERRLTILTVP
jgi:predicted Zn-dependent peptidase